MSHRQNSFLAALVVLGCASPPAVDTPSKPKRTVPRQAATGLIRGVAEVPANLIGKAGSSVISNHGGSVVSNHGANLTRTLQETAPDAPLKSARVYLTDARLAPLAEMPETRTDAQGRFRLTGVPSGLRCLVVVEAPNLSPERLARLRTLALAASEPPEVTVNLFSTALAAHLVRPDTDLSKTDPEQFQEIVTAKIWNVLKAGGSVGGISSANGGMMFIPLQVFRGEGPVDEAALQKAAEELLQASSELRAAAAAVSAGNASPEVGPTEPPSPSSTPTPTPNPSATS